MSEPFHEKLYRYLREGRAATDAWNDAYLERNGLKPLLQRLEAGEITGLGDFGGARPDVHVAPPEAPAPSPPVADAPGPVRALADDDAPALCECGLTVTHRGYLALHRAGDVHRERMARGGAAA